MKDELLLQQRVIDELEFDPAVKAEHIGVAVHDGVVALSGHVESFAEKFAAERAARRVKGVKAVAEELDVHLPADHKTSDDEIAARALKILAWDMIVPADRIAIKVERGIVTLTGEVDWQFQRAEAERDVRKLGGVRAVINEITLKPALTAEDVQTVIRAALERHAEIEADHISVGVENGKVTLSGRVTAWSEREAAERAAWSLPGVREVEDRIELTRP